jgi:hypothetical protein
MPLPACSTDLNTEWFAAITAQINSVSSAAELQALVNEVYGTIALLNSTIESQLTYLAPLAALLTPPTDLTSVITWITGMITFLTEQYAPVAKMTAQLAAIVTEVASLTAAVESTAALKFPGVTIVIPSVAAFCEL